MFLLILLIAVLNLGIGCFAAIYLGQGPPGLMEAWEALQADSRRTKAVAKPAEPPAELLAAPPENNGRAQSPEVSLG